jgi:MFS family permease
VQDLARVSTVGPVHSVFTKNQKWFIVFMASFGGLFSGLSANTYYPALNAVALDLGVTSSLINLTLTSYMVCQSVELSSWWPAHPPVQIFQGIAPSVIGNVADSAGRRPAYTICFVIYIGANVGLALQNNYAALFVLRCVQSSGSSGTIALSSGVVSDIATVSERGKYLGFTTVGSLLGPAFGPVVGGVLVRQGAASRP